MAATRPEKNHNLFLDVAAHVFRKRPDARFVIVGDGPERRRLESLARRLQLDGAVQFLGTRGDVPELLSMMDVFLLTSHNEANPVSILEAMSVSRPVVATRVGSVSESVEDTVTGYLASPGDAPRIADRLLHLFSHPELAREMGRRGRKKVVENASLGRMIEGYQDLITEIYERKCGRRRLSDAPTEAPEDALAGQALPQ